MGRFESGTFSAVGCFQLWEGHLVMGHLESGTLQGQDILYVHG